MQAFLNMVRKLYYMMKPLIPRRTLLSVRRKIIQRQRKVMQHIWPVDPASAIPPPNWRGWPEGKRFALVLTHDVETIKGHDLCLDLMNLEKAQGFRSSYNFVAERYRVSPTLRGLLTKNGFEVGVHGLKHDGKLYQSRQIFLSRARKINEYLREWKAVGFRSPSMHHNLEWIGDLDIKYDASTFDTDPFEPQPDGVGTIFPFYVHNHSTGRGYVELPYTLVQDFTLFILMQEKNISMWKQKLDWIAEQGGMALLITHPDYMNFPNGESREESYPVDYYVEILKYVEEYYSGQYWLALPKEVAHFYMTESQKTLYESDVES